MTAPAPTRRLQVLFLVALVGVLAALGVAVHALLGTVGAVVYAVAAVVLLLAGAAAVRRAQVLAQDAREAAGRTCTCCTSSQHDPVTVV